MEMHPILAVFVAAVTLVSTACSSPLAAIPVRADDNNTLVVAIGSVRQYEDGTFLNVLDKTSTSNNSHRNGTRPPSPFMNRFSGTVGPNNSIYIVGASLKGYREKAMFLSYDVQADKWTALPPLPVDDEPASMVIVGTQLLAIGFFPFGYMNKQRAVDEYVYAFDLSAQNQTWVEIPTPLPRSDFSVCAVARNDTVYYLVETGDLFRSVDGAQSWTQLTPAPDARLFAGCAALDDTIVVAGGIGDDALTAAVYDISKNEWRNTQPMSKARPYAKAVVVPTAGGRSQVVVCGGQDENALSYEDCEQLDLSANQWSPSGFTLGARFIKSVFELFAVTQN